VTQTIRICLLLVASAALVFGQGQTVSSKTRPENNQNAQGTELGTKPSAVLELLKAKGVLRSIDLNARTVVIDSGKKSGQLTLGFAQPAGREQIKASKKLAKSSGRPKLSLEELKPGASVEIRYYSALSQMLEMIVARAGS